MRKHFLAVLTSALLLSHSAHASLIALYGFEDYFNIGNNDANPGILTGTPYGDISTGSSLHPGLGERSLYLGLSGNSPTRGLNLPDNSNILNGTRYATLSTFFSVSSIPDTGGANSLIWIGRNGMDSQVRLALQIADNGGIRLIGRATDGGNSSSVNFPVGITIDTLYHVAATIDIATGEVQLYVNGALFGTQTAGVNLIAASGFFPNTNSNKAAIGANNGGTERITGIMDDVRIYNEILSAQQIADLAAAGGLIPEPSSALLTFTASCLLLGLRRRPKIDTIAAMPHP